MVKATQTNTQNELKKNKINKIIKSKMIVAYLFILFFLIKINNIYII